jgi:hypothetical protein
MRDSAGLVTPRRRITLAGWGWSVPLLWTAVGAGILLTRGGLDPAWAWFQHASVPLQVGGAVLLLPWALAAATWHAGWTVWLGVLAVCGVVSVWFRLLPPRRES